MGFEATVDVENGVHIDQIMSTLCHVGCVRSTSASGKYAVTGGTDELINVFDVSKRRHLGTMGGSVHTSTITAVGVTPVGGLLVSGCDDGQIAITRLKDSETLKSFKGHKSAVLDIACHPSGRVALSISTDNTLRMWDLTRGTCAAVRTVCPIKRPNALRGAVSAATMQVKYTPEGSRYAILLPGGRIEICSSASADVMEHEGSNCTSICAVTEDLFLLGDSKGTLQLLQMFPEGCKIISELSQVHEGRIKGLARVSSNLAVSACASGRLVFVRFDKDTVEIVRTIETGSRITCFSSNC